jgi:hypothetical protein
MEFALERHQQLLAGRLVNLVEHSLSELHNQHVGPDTLWICQVYNRFAIENYLAAVTSCGSDL